MRSGHESLDIAPRRGGSRIEALQHSMNNRSHWGPPQADPATQCSSRTRKVVLWLWNSFNTLGGQPCACWPVSQRSPQPPLC
jgi:hypothetical protein